MFTVQSSRCRCRKLAGGPPGLHCLLGWSSTSPLPPSPAQGGLRQPAGPPYSSMPLCCFYSGRAEERVLKWESEEEEEEPVGGPRYVLRRMVVPSFSKHRHAFKAGGEEFTRCHCEEEPDSQTDVAGTPSGSSKWGPESHPAPSYIKDLR